jgi:hypothetical protein
LGYSSLSFLDYALSTGRQTGLWITPSPKLLCGDDGAMSTSKPRPALAGRPRRFWFDPRFAIGALLVVASVLGVVAVVSTADATTLVYAARNPLSPGDRVTSDDFVESSVRLDSAEQLYLLPGDVPNVGLVITKPVAAGELVPASAVGASAGLTLAAVVVSLGSELPESVGPGTALDLWAATEIQNGEFGPPAVIVSSAIVVRIAKKEGLVVNGAQTTVELLVPRLRIARVLEAIANKDALSVIPSSIPAKG